MSDKCGMYHHQDKVTCQDNPSHKAYLRKYVVKNNASQATDRVNELVDEEHEQPMGLETEANSENMINPTNKPVAMPSLTSKEQPEKSDMC